MKLIALSALVLLASTAAFAMGGAHAKNTWSCVTSGSDHIVTETVCHPGPTQPDCQVLTHIETYTYWSDDQSTEAKASKQALDKCLASDPEPAACDTTPECHYVN